MRRLMILETSKQLTPNRKGKHNMNVTQKKILKAASLNPQGRASMIFASRADVADCCDLVSDGLATFDNGRIAITLSGRKLLEFSE